MPSRANLDTSRQARAEGYYPVGKRTVQAHGRLVNETDYLTTNGRQGPDGKVVDSKQKQRVKRTARLATTIALAPTGLPWTSKYFSKQRKLGFSGRAIQTVFEPADRSVTARVNSAAAFRLGYNPKSTQGIRTWAADPENQKKFERMNGHKVLPQYGRDGISSFLFAPNGDFSKVRSIQTWNSTNGAMLKGGAFFRAMQDYTTLYERIQSGWEKEIDNYLLNDRTLSRESFEKLNMVFVIHPKDHTVRAFAPNYNPNKVNIASIWQGIVLDTGDSSIWSEVDGNHNRHTSEYKKTINPFERSSHGRSDNVADTSESEDSEPELSSADLGSPLQRRRDQPTMQTISNLPDLAGDDPSSISSLTPKSDDRDHSG